MSKKGSNSNQTPNLEANLKEGALTVPEIVEKEGSDIEELNYPVAFEKYSDDEKAEILALSEAIDLKKLDNIMDYGSAALVKTFQQCGEFLKDERGSDADQKVIKEVIELTQKANKSYEDFELQIKEPNLLQKVILKIFNAAKKTRKKKIQEAAVTNYKLLIELQDSCESWIELLKKSMGDIYSSFYSDVESVTLLEKYLVAGYKAKPRLEAEVSALEEEAKNTGLQEDMVKYDEAKFSYDTFLVVLSNLERSRVLYHLSCAELSSIRKSNYQTQTGIRTQMNNSMALLGQQLRNAIHDAKNQEVLEGQKAINRLNEEIMIHVANSVKNTALDSTKLMYNGFCDVDAAKKAITTVVDSYNEVGRLAQELLPKMQAETQEISELVEQLKPVISDMNIKKNSNSSSSSSKPKQISKSNNSALKF